MGVPAEWVHATSAVFLMSVVGCFGGSSVAKYEEKLEQFSQGCRRGCKKKGQSTAFCTEYCGCVLTALTQERTPGEFDQFVVQSRQDRRPEAIKEMEVAARGCLTQFRRRN